LSGLGLGAAALPNIPVLGKPVSLDAGYSTIDAAIKKKLADVALNAAHSKGATYADVRIGRYLNQSIITRENRVQNIANTESYGMGITTTLPKLLPWLLLLQKKIQGC